MPGYKLEVKGLSKTFDGHGKLSIVALQEVSLFVREGEFVSLIGPSGCGKSTLLDIVAGLTRPDEGDVLLDGASIVGLKGKVSYMPQKDVLFPWRTVLDNVIVPLEVQGINRKEAREKALSLLPVFGLGDFSDKYPPALSGGMRQRAAFLRTYLCGREILLLDEPFGKLDALTRRQMQQWLLDIWQNFQHAVLLVTHDVDEAIMLSNRIYVLSARPGRVIAEVEVPLPRPRHAQMALSQEFTEIKARLLKALEEGSFGEVSNKKCLVISAS
ncbi:ABC transporter [Thermincola ferriacetica]|uniref:ABC transporter related protein n=2 Tax=Thermincola TaxID=278993 RepID=D5X8W1_THEPJ|nr:MULTISPECIES: ABC transporter ATP-binding protein [Thermincola]ADG80961.1 ABC transporter related protein [Thermincola potens JR]KNZ68788.1 ABC transporter [Thermincola ferriacetica]